MIGQKNLLKKLMNYTTNTMPHSILLVGESGSEEEELCKIISDHLGLEYFKVDKIDADTLTEIYECSIRSLFLIDLNNISIGDQMLLLKIFEEPSPYIYFILTARNDDLILDTIKTRSYKFNFDFYTPDELDSLIINKEAIKNNTPLVRALVKTPGQAEIFNNMSGFNEMVSLCDKIINSKISEAECLNISNLINFSDEYSKYDLLFFIRTLKYFSMFNNIDKYDIILLIDRWVWTLSNKKNYIDLMILNLQGYGNNRIKE